MALLITKIGSALTQTKDRTDGSGKFTTTDTPFTLRAKFGDTGGFQMGVVYTIWLATSASKKVALIAQAFIDGTAQMTNGDTYHSDNRLAVVNDAECFEFGQIKNKEWTDAQGVKHPQVAQTIWLKDKTMVMCYDILELAVNAQRGNINDLDVLVDFKGAELLNAPVASATSTTAVDPF